MSTVCFDFGVRDGFWTLGYGILGIMVILEYGCFAVGVGGWGWCGFWNMVCRRFDFGV